MLSDRLAWLVPDCISAWEAQEGRDETWSLFNLSPGEAEVSRMRAKVDGPASLLRRGGRSEMGRIWAGVQSDKAVDSVRQAPAIILQIWWLHMHTCMTSTGDATSDCQIAAALQEEELSARPAAAGRDDERAGVISSDMPGIQRLPPTATRVVGSLVTGADRVAETRASRLAGFRSWDAARAHDRQSRTFTLVQAVAEGCRPSRRRPGCGGAMGGQSRRRSHQGAL